MKVTHMGTLLAAMVLAVAPARAATITWTTGAGDANWSTAGNWTGANTPPLSGDSLVFGATAGATTLNNDLTLTNLGSITFNAGAPAYTIDGNATGSGSAGSIGGFVINSANNVTQTININFTSHQNAINVTGSGHLALGGTITKGGNWNPYLNMSGSGVLTLNGTNYYGSGNLLNPITVNSGTLMLSKTMEGRINLQLLISNGGTVKQGASNQLSGVIVALAGGTFDLAGYDAGRSTSSGIGGLRGSSGQVVNSGLSGTNTLNLLPGTASFGGTITDGATAKIALAATSTGSSLFQALFGNNTYGGGTTWSGAGAGAVTLSIAGIRNIGAAGSRNLVFDAANSVGGSYLQLTGTEITDSSAFDSITFNTNKWAGFDIADSSHTFTLGTAVNSGAGGVLGKRGAGTLVLSGAATYTGATALNGGILKVDYEAGGSLASTPPNFSGGTLSLLGKTSGATTQALGSVTVGTGGGKLLIDPNGNDFTLNLNNLTATAAGGGLLLGKDVGAGTGTVVITTTTARKADGTYGGRVIFADGAANTGYDFATTASGGSPYTLSAYTNASELPTSVGSSATNYKMTAGTTLIGNVAANSLKLEAPAGDLALGAHTLTVTGLLATGTSAAQITGDAGVTGITAASEILVHQFNSAGLTIGAVISGNILTKAGPGTLTLGGINTYTGATYVIGGTLAITDNNQLGAVGTGATLNLYDGTLATTGSFALDNAGTNKRALTIGTGGGGFKVGSGTLTVSGSVTASGMLAKRGAGTLLLSAANTLLGGVTIDDGTLRLGSANALQNSGGAASSSLVLGGSNTPTLQLNGFDTAVLSLVSANSAAVVENGVAGAKTITVNNGADNTFAGVLRNGTAGTLGLAKTGAGALTLSGANTYSGATTVSAGTLALSGLLSNTAIAVASGATFTQSVSGVIAGSASITNNGTTILAGANTYTGGTTLASGVLTLGASGVLADNGAVTINGTGATFAVNGQTETIGRLTGTGGTLDMGSNGVLTVNYGNTASTLASALAGSGTLAIVGTGGQYGNSYDLTGNSSNFTGRISISNGILRANSDTALGAVPGSFVADAITLYASAAFSSVGSLTISANRGILLNGGGLFTGDLIVNSVISGASAVNIRSASAGAITFAGTNTYSGGTQIYTDDGNSSTLRLGANDPLPYGTGKGGLDIRAWNTGKAKFDLNGYSQTVNGLTSTGTTSPTNSIIDNIGTADSTLTVGANNANGNSYGGIIRNSGTHKLHLTKIGTGTQTLSGVNTYLGATTVSNGTLALAGSGTLGGSNIVISAGATLRVTGRTNASLVLAAGQALSGNGAFAGALNNDGSVTPGSTSPGTLTVNGDFAQTNGTLNIRIASGVNGLLSVTNTAVLGGTLTVTLEGYTPATNDVFLILTAATITGEFATTNLPSLAEGEGWLLEISGGQVLLLSVTGAPPASAIGYDLYAQAITNPALRGIQDDADADGYANLLEYATGGNAASNDTISRMSGARSDGVLSLLFHHDTNTTDATLIVEGAYSATSDAAWNGIATNLAGSWGGATNVVENTATNPANVTVSDTAGPSTNRFLRLRVTRP